MMPPLIRPIEILSVIYILFFLISGLYKWIYITRFSALVEAKKKETPIQFQSLYPRCLFIPILSYFYEFYLIFRITEKPSILKIIRILTGLKIVELISVVLLFQTFWQYPVNSIAFSMYHLVLIGKMFCRHTLLEKLKIDYLGR